MQVFQLSYNQFSGNLPSDIGANFPNLLALVVFANQLQGPIPNSLSNCSELYMIAVAYNKFTGPMPSSIGNLQNLETFASASNLLEATAPRQWNNFMDALTNCTGLQVLDLGDNQPQGFIPSSVGNLSSDLFFFSLQTNPISGNIPADIGKLTGLTRIQLSNMQLRGTIPQEIGRLWRLEMIDLANNTRRNSTDFWQPYQDEPSLLPK